MFFIQVYAGTLVHRRTRKARNAGYVRRKKSDAAGGDVCIHGVGVLEEQPVALPDDDRNAHTLVLGTTRVGKTRLLEIMATQDIRRPGAVVIIDPKGDADLLARVSHEAGQAGKRFICFHLGYPDASARYNGIGEFTRITEVATRISNQLAGEGNSAAFKQFAWRFVNIITKAVVELGATPDYVAIVTHVDQYRSAVCAPPSG